MVNRHRFTFLAAGVLLLALTGAPAVYAQCGPMDVVFVIDNTGSMTDVIGEVQNQVNVIADSVTRSSNGDYQFGLVVAPRNDVVVLLDLDKNNRDAFGTAARYPSEISVWISRNAVPRSNPARPATSEIVISARSASNARSTANTLPADWTTFRSFSAIRSHPDVRIPNICSLYEHT